jgi:hypothetical protein
MARIFLACVLAVLLFVHEPARAQTNSTSANGVTAQQVQTFLDRLAAQEARIQELELKVQRLTGTATPAVSGASERAAVPIPPAPAAAPQTAATRSSANPASALPQEAAPPTPPDSAPAPEESMDHIMAIPHGPALHIRGFFDFDFDKGLAAQNLQYPVGSTPNATFRAGEFDLFMTSQLSDKLNFLAELVFGVDQTNAFYADVERFELTYRPSKYFEISAGRFHTDIGYYNTAFHHGTWFSTATGRPFMYYWEDSGGVLPVHEVGVTSTGFVPGSGKFNLHWTAEIGNGSAEFGSSDYGDGVESFASDRNRKDLNFAVYSKPEWLSGLQFGGSFLTGDLIPASGIVPKVNQTISSVYAVFINSQWEFMNEAVLLRHQIPNGRSYNSPLSYTQLAYRIGKYHPYFRFQENNIPNNDPVAQFTGRYEGPSVGLRLDYFTYAALKLQYNRIYLRDAAAQNGVELQMAFTF